MVTVVTKHLPFRKRHPAPRMRSKNTRTERGVRAHMKLPSSPVQFGSDIAIAEN